MDLALVGQEWLHPGYHEWAIPPGSANTVPLARKRELVQVKSIHVCITWFHCKKKIGKRNQRTRSAHGSYPLYRKGKAHMKHCNRNWKKTGIIWSLILFFGLFFLAGAAVSAEALPSYTEFTKISDGGFGDPQNNYAWSVSEFKGDLYVGTGRNVPYMVSLAMKKQGAFPENMTISTLTHPAGAAPPPLVLPNQSPPSREDVITWSNDMRPEIWRYHEGSWSQVHQASTFINPLNGYTYPEGIGYRIMTTFTDTRGTDALYAGVGFGFGRILIVKSIDGVTWMPVNTSSIPSRDTRAMTAHNGKLYVGTADGLYASGSPTPYADTWEKVADFQVASLRSFNGYLYAGTGNPNGPSETDGFEVWRSTVASPSGPEIGRAHV